LSASMFLSFPLRPNGLRTGMDESPSRLGFLGRLSEPPSPGSIIDGSDMSLVLSGTPIWTICILSCPNISRFPGVVLSIIGRLCRTSATIAGTVGFDCRDWM